MTLAGRISDTYGRKVTAAENDKVHIIHPGLLPEVHAFPQPAHAPPPPPDSTQQAGPLAAELPHLLQVANGPGR